MHDTAGFTPRTAIVTGSDSGIGKAAAFALARAGMDVGVTWHSDKAGAEGTAEEIRGLGRKAVVRQLDTTDLHAAAAVVDELAEGLGGVDVFVNNAGTGDGTKFLDIDVDTWMRTLDTNLNGAFVCLQAAARRMVKAGRGGRLIAVTSVHEFQPRVGAAAYDASKHGLGGLMKTLALELAEHGITANSVAPGEIATPVTGQENEDAATKDRPGVPLGRPGDAREVAAVIAFLASPASSYVNGASWAVDGGMLQMGPQAGSHITSQEWREG
ncbi:SDR family oxidoreductase [Pseudarthrobacter oxydans]|uniref:SDR family oxidoreductase n=1 Tax=Pseudarthrobacter oxydans TaxID=1671 RepID=UPI001571CB97|nr:SDR family oxidoreductase [Pseudarthrobacter oxydans]NSX37313.1 SDR family oxidoreductase [Pseudarthrobacter oxydans]